MIRLLLLLLLLGWAIHGRHVLLLLRFVAARLVQLERIGAAEQRLNVVAGQSSGSGGCCRRALGRRKRWQLVLGQLMMIRMNVMVNWRRQRWWPMSAQ